MSGKSITLDLPEELYERVRQVAEQSQRPLERVLVESIRLLFVLPPTATVTRLQMNRSIVVQARQRWVQAGWHPPKIT